MLEQTDILFGASGETKILKIAGLRKNSFSFLEPTQISTKALTFLMTTRLDTGTTSFMKLDTKQTQISLTRIRCFLLIMRCKYMTKNNKKNIQVLLLILSMTEVVTKESIS